MSAKRRPGNRAPASFSHDRDLESRLDRTFFKVREFVCRADPSLIGTTLHIGCLQIHRQRRGGSGHSGPRSFMHVGHMKRKICAIRKAAVLSDSHLVGLFLHEFGHLAGGDDEPSADAWVKRNLGIEIFYRGPLELQWVAPYDAVEMLR